MAPEILGRGGYVGKSADIWALGILLYRIISGAFPFRGINDKVLYRKIVRGQYK